MPSSPKDRDALRKRRREHMLEAFNVYRTTTLVDVLDRPQAFAFVDGLVIGGPARVVSADPAGLVLAVQRDLLAALERTGTVLLESPLHGMAFRARVEAVDRRRAYVCLSHLEPFCGYQERRASCRTVPGMPLVARVRGHGEEASGRVVDLSVRSVAADFERARFARVARAPVVRLEVWGEHNPACPLPGFITTASVRRTGQPQPGRDEACRVVLDLDAYPALARALRRYVARRQRNILTQLRLAGCKLERRAGVLPGTVPEPAA